MTINPKVVDLYHGDDLVYTDAEHDFAAAFGAGIRGIIHKATEGLTDVDARYHAREAAAREAGMLWGAYHFMRPGDPVQQAQHFLSTALPDIVNRHPCNIRLVLDHEDPKVPLWAAQRWLEVVRQATGQYPWLYSGFLVKQQVDGRHMPAFAEYPLWLAEYGPEPKVPVPWKKCVLWQFTDGNVGPQPHAIAGIAHKNCDISSFDGTDEALRAAWLGEEKIA